jgi:hypothetical protein
MEQLLQRRWRRAPRSLEDIGRPSRLVSSAVAGRSLPPSRPEPPSRESPVSLKIGDDNVADAFGNGPLLPTHPKGPKQPGSIQNNKLSRKGSRPDAIPV